MPGTCQTLINWLYVALFEGWVGECQRSVSGVILQPPSTLLSETDSLTGLELAMYTRLACWQAPEIGLSLPPQYLDYNYSTPHPASGGGSLQILLLSWKALYSGS